MNSRFLILVCIAIFLGSCSSRKASHSNHFKLWFDRPAHDWMKEGFPIGNGFMGVMFMGDPRIEHIQFSEESLWAGGPNSGTQYNFGLKVGAASYLPQIRELLYSGKAQKAYDLTQRWMTGIINPRESLDFGDYGAHQSMGDLFVSVEINDFVYDYRRELDLNSGIGRIFYRDGETMHKRTFFGCYPYRTMVYNFTNTSKDGINYTLELTSPHIVDSIIFLNSALHLYGHLGDNNLEFITTLIIETDGSIDYKGNTLRVSDAKNLTIKHLAFTAYAPLYPHYCSTGYLQKASDVIKQVEKVGFEELKQSHLEDYTSLFNRVSINISGPSHDSIPLDRRMAKYAQGEVDVGLEQLYFQYARYIMISGSRPGSLPLNLQGKWNNSINPPWACDYHTNINLQMLYWPAEVCNLSECHRPLMDFLQTLVEPGQKAASEFFGTRGWIVNTMCNVYGFTSPGWELPWGFFPAGAAWLCRNAWDHFDFTQDTAFLSDIAFPLMKEAALFWMDYLVEDSNGYLISSPSFSPEHGGISSGASMDHQIAWDLFNNCAKAAKILSSDEREKLAFIEYRDRIYPPLIGHWGQMQEWIEDADDPENKHRHVSHLFALYPGEQVSPLKTPELASAALTSLNARGKGGTGWSLAWKINFFARLHKGNDAYGLLRHLLIPVETTAVNMTEGGSYFNLLCAHPPFQLDGNMGGAAGMAEMIIQSHENMIFLLPAIPQMWPKGEVKGLKARGGFEVDLIWDDFKVKSVLIKGKPGSEGVCHFREKTFPFKIPLSGQYNF